MEAAGQNARPSQDRAPVLEVCALVKRFGATVVVDGVSFSVAEGEVVGFVGPNGAGKSTTMKMICGLLRQDSGSVTLDRTTLDGDSPAYLSKLGALIESPAFYPGLDASSHLAYLARVRRQYRPSRIADALTRVGLHPSSRKPVRKYSTGMKQRLGIAMAILHMPKLLLLDEPTNGLDPAAIVALRDLLRQLAGAGTAVLISSHLLYEIEQVCDRVVFIKAGRIVRNETISGSGAGAARLLIRSSRPQAVRQFLDNQDFVLQTEPTEKGIVCTVPVAAIGQVAAAVVGAGFDLLELSPAPVGLENAYVAEYGSGMQEGRLK